METSRLEMLKAMLQTDPDDPVLYYMLANEYMKLEQYPEVVEHLQTYLRLQEDEGAAYRLLGEALRRLGRIEEARRAYQEGIQTALKHNHPSMAEEFQESLRDLEGA
ncbi:MAG: tetratricopeptide repeat protein [candidate division NC10 bacterium]|nr:tetratricopeptide repeat protein [candidate division NC10 bacterium]